MTLTPLKSMLAAAAALVSLFAPATEAARAGKQLPYAPELVGTWSTKSETVMTGPVCTPAAVVVRCGRSCGGGIGNKTSNYEKLPENTAKRRRQRSWRKEL